MEVLGIKMTKTIEALYAKSDIFLLETMRPVLEHFKLLEGASSICLGMFFNLIKKYKNINISKIHIDIVNKLSPWEIALKHFQPIEVINDIVSGNYDKNKKIIPSKWYTVNELTNILCYSDTSLHAAINNLGEHEYIHRIEKNKRIIKFILGKHIIANIKEISKYNNIKNIDNNIVAIYNPAEASRILDINCYENRIIFGVNIREFKKNNRIIGFYKEDVELALLAKKQYILTSNLLKYSSLNKEERRGLICLLQLYNIANKNKFENLNRIGARKYIRNDTAIIVEKLSEIIISGLTTDKIIAQIKLIMVNKDVLKTRISLDIASTCIYLFSNKISKSLLCKGSPYGFTFDPNKEIKNDTISLNLLYKILEAKLVYLENKEKQRRDNDVNA